MMISGLSKSKSFPAIALASAEAYQSELSGAPENFA